MKFTEFTEICKKHGLKLTIDYYEDQSQYTLPYIVDNDFLCRYDFDSSSVWTAVDIRILESWEKGKTCLLGFKSEMRVKTKKELEEQIEFLKKRYKEIMLKFKLDRIKKDF
jgi:hypothetical protein